MRLMLLSLIGLLAAESDTWAQRRGQQGPGSVLFPGGIPNNGSVLNPGGSLNNSFPTRLGQTISGNPPYTGVAPGGNGGGGGRGSRGGNPRTVIVPYAFPVFYDGGYYQQQAPNVTVVMPQQTTPAVVINQTFGVDTQATRQTSFHEVQPGSETEIRRWESSSTSQRPPEPAKSTAEDKPNIYTIAMKDGGLRSAIGYWVDNNTLHYVTPNGKIEHISMDGVDAETSERLNRDKKLDLDLQGAAR